MNTYYWDPIIFKVVHCITKLYTVFQISNPIIMHIMEYYYSYWQCYRFPIIFNCWVTIWLTFKINLKYRSHQTDYFTANFNYFKLWWLIILKLLYFWWKYSGILAQELAIYTQTIRRAISTYMPQQILT